MSELVVYEDTRCKGVLLTKGASVGHLRIEPKEEYFTLEDLPRDLATHLFFVANTSAGVLFEALGLGGTNVIATSHPKEKIALHVIPRKPEDGLDFFWEPQKVPEEEMKQVQSKIKDAAFMINYKEPVKKVINLDEKQKEPEQIDQNKYSRFFRRSV